MVREVAALATYDPGEMYEAALMSMEGDSGAQRSVFRTFDSRGSLQFGPL